MINNKPLHSHKDYVQTIEYFKSEVYNTFPEMPSFEAFELFWIKGDRSVYESIYFKRRSQLTYLGLLVLDQPRNKTYKSKLENLIFSICNEFTWCLPAHVDRNREFNPKIKQYTLDLFACETAFTLVELSNLLKGVLSESLNTLIQSTVHERVLTPFLKESWGFEKLNNNWSAVCAGSIGITALYLLEDTDKDRVVILERVHAAMDVFLEGFGDDGACLEGLNYWEYGFRYFTYYMDCLSTRTSNNYFETLNQDKIKNIATFQQKMYLYDRTVINTSDSPSVLEPAHDLAGYYKGLFPEDVEIPNTALDIKSLVDHCGRWAPMIRTLQWSDFTKSKEDKSEKIDWLEDAQMLIYKNQNFQVVTKGGTNDEPHNHNDLGHFMIFYRNKPYCIDLGAPEYTKDYFSDKRYETIQASSLGHSVPIINESAQCDGANNKSYVERMDQTELEVEYNLTRAYEDKQLSLLERKFKINAERHAVVIKDHFVFNTTQNEVKQRFILSDMELLSVNGQEVHFEKEGSYFKVTILNRKAVFNIKTFHYNDHFGNRQNALTLDITFDFLDTEERIEIELSCLGKEEEEDV